MTSSPPKERSRRSRSRSRSLSPNARPESPASKISRIPRILRIPRVETNGSLERTFTPTHTLDHSGTQAIYTSIANNQCWKMDGKYYMVFLHIYKDCPLTNRFLELTTELLINPVARVGRSEQSEQTVKSADKLSEGIYTFMTCYDKYGEIMIFLMKAASVFEFGTKHIQMLARARRFLHIDDLDSLKIWYTGEIIVDVYGQIWYNFMSGTFSMYKYTTPGTQLDQAKTLVETILKRLGHTSVSYTREVLLTSSNLPLKRSNLTFFQENGIRIFEFRTEPDCEKFNEEVQLIPVENSDEATVKAMDDAAVIANFHRAQNTIFETIKIKVDTLLKKTDGKIYSPDKTCNWKDAVRNCVLGPGGLNGLLNKVRTFLSPFILLNRNFRGGQNQYKYRNKKYKTGIRNNRTRTRTRTRKMRRQNRSRRIY